MKPRIGLLPGDPGGIGPELVARATADGDLAERARVLLIGDAPLFESGQTHAGIRIPIRTVDAWEGDWTSHPGILLHPIRTVEEDGIGIPEIRTASGRSSLAVLDAALDLARAGRIDAIVFGPFNKAALHAAGMGYEDELRYMAARLGVEGHCSELNTLDGLWTSRVTSHVPLRRVADLVTGDRIADAARLIDATLRRAGVERPRIAVAGLNPHAGDGGNFGREEIETIRPAVEALARSGLDIDGPWPSDTVFLKARRGEADAVVTMYHDQGQIALKLMGFDRGVTVLGGMPFPIATPAHGTAFDIAGRGIADPGAMLAALAMACDMATRWGAEP